MMEAVGEKGLEVVLDMMVNGRSKRHLLEPRTELLIGASQIKIIHASLVLPFKETYD